MTCGGLYTCFAMDGVSFRSDMERLHKFTIIKDDMSI
jgi:hypothetical protein